MSDVKRFSTRHMDHVLGEVLDGDFVRSEDYDALAAELAAEKENSRRGWELFETFRRRYAELRYPGMTGEVHAATIASPDAKEGSALDRGGEHE